MNDRHLRGLLRSLTYAPYEAPSLLEGVRSAHSWAPVPVAEFENAASTSDLAFPGTVTSVVARHFHRGDWHAPHVVGEELPEHVDWVVMLPLADEPRDGICRWVEGGFAYHEDRALRPLALDPRVWCWTRPVSAPERDLVVVGGHNA